MDTDVSVRIPCSPSSSDKHKLKDHIAEIFDTRRMLELYESSALMDVKLIAELPENRVEIKAHRVVLSLASQYFYDLLRKSESGSRIKIFGVDPQCLNAIIGFIYTGLIHVSDENVETLYQSAELLAVTRVKDDCQEYLVNNIDDGNWHRRLHFAGKHNCDDLTEVVISYISDDNKYLHYMQTPQFLELCYNDVITILNAPARLENPEESIFTSVIKWLKADEKKRLPFAAKLIKKLDLTSLPEDFLQFHVDRESVLHTFEFLQVFKKTVKSLSHHQDQDQDSLQNSRVRGTVEDQIYAIPQPLSAPPHKPMICMIDGSVKLESLSQSHEQINVHSTELTPPPQKKSRGLNKNYVDLSVDSSIPGVAKSNPVSESESRHQTAIYKSPKRSTARKKTGGLRKHYDTVKVSNITQIKPSQNNLGKTITVSVSPNLTIATTNGNVIPNTQVSSAITTTPTPANVHVDSKAVNSNNVRGRINSPENGNDVIVYLREYAGEALVMMTDLCMKDPRQLRPFFRNNKSPALVWSSAVRRLYALGGLSSVLKEAGSSTAVRYSPEINLMKNFVKEKHWRKGPQMIQERSKFKAVILGDFIYAFGGAEGIAGNEAVNCAEKLSLVAKRPKWEEIDFLQRARHGFGTGIINGKIYVCGGYGATDGSNDANMGILGTVECYDPKKDEWKFVASMIQERHNLSVTVLDSKLYAIGGGGVKSHTDPEADLENMTSVEVYDPNEDSWTLIGNLNKPRKNGSAVTLNGKIYAIGGDQAMGEDKSESSVEVYSPEEDKWTVCIQKLDPEGNFSTVAVVDLKYR